MIKFFMSHNGQVVQLPVNPENFLIKTPGNNKSVVIVTLGEIKLIKKHKLARFSIKSFFPKDSQGSYVMTKDNFKEPEFYINFIDSIRDSGLPARLIVTDLDVSMEVAVDDFNPEREHGTDDVNYEMTLTQYKHHAPKQLQPVTQVSEEVVQVSATEPPRAKTGFAIADSVVVNGTYYSSSYGTGSKGSVNKYSGKISHIVTDLSRPNRYHITSTAGSYLGWVKESQLVQT